MEIKVGQWVRNNNNIFQFMGYCDCEQCIKRGFQEPILQGTDSEYITDKEWWELFLKQSKVKDTPKELIQAGDLVFYEDGEKIFVDEKMGNALAQKFKKGLICKLHFRITKILTPNEDKTQYTLQWEAK